MSKFNIFSFILETEYILSERNWKNIWKAKKKKTNFKENILLSNNVHDNVKY